MNLYRLLSDGVQREVDARRIFGVVIAVVSNNQDDEGLHRVKVTFPWLSDDEESHWARVVSFMAGAQYGAVFLPEVGDEVLVAFEHGDIDRPCVLGALWNGVDKPPITNDDGDNNRRVLRSRSGHRVTFDDTDGSEKIRIEDKSEKNSIEWDTAKGTITIAAEQQIQLKTPDGKLSIDAKEVLLKASGDATVEACGTLTLKGSTVNIN